MTCRRLVGPEPTTDALACARSRSRLPSAIDYYGMIDATGPAPPRSGDTVVFGFRGQAFVTRAYSVGIAGCRRGTPHVEPDRELFWSARTLAPFDARPLMTPVLQLKNIRKSFGGVTAIEDFSLDLHAGEVVALVGDNGAGKSTLIKMISGVYPPSSGEILLDGQAASFADASVARERGIEVVYQDLALADQQTGLHEPLSGPRAGERASAPAGSRTDDRRNRGAGEGT